MCVIRDLKTLSEMYTTKMLTKEEFVILKEMTIKEAIKKDLMSSETTSEETTSTQTAEGSQHTAAESPSVNEAADDEAADDEAADDDSSIHPSPDEEWVRQAVFDNANWTIAEPNFKANTGAGTHKKWRLARSDGCYILRNGDPISILPPRSKKQTPCFPKATKLRVNKDGTEPTLYYQNVSKAGVVSQHQIKWDCVDSGWDTSRGHHVQA
jgi:hypothetical protein